MYILQPSIWTVLVQNLKKTVRLRILNFSINQKLHKKYELNTV